MSLIVNDKNINQIITISRKFYDDTFNENSSNIKIYASDNIPKDAKIFSEHVIVPDNLEKLYGVYIEPNIKSSVTTILIKYNAFNETGAPFAGTLMHELTHASDFEKFNLEYCNGNWINIRKHKYYSAMCFWSEYHAKVIEIIHSKILLSILRYEGYIYNPDFIKREMLNYQLPRYNYEIVDLIDNNEATLDSIFQYCGRLYVCKMYDSNLNLTNIIPQQVFNAFPDIIELYNWLNPIQTYYDVSSKLDELTSSLSNFV